jgi:NitT/TauT family transport system ATP-binding protein
LKINITKKYNDLFIFDHFEMDVVENKINVILGPSGCGKTTLLQCIANLTDYEGKIDNGVKHISYVFQEDRLFPYLKIFTNLSIISKDIDKINYFLKQFEVYDLKDKYPNQLSGGEKQRISIIRAFLGSSEIVLMDEPFKSLDLNLKLSLIEIVNKIQQETKKTLILVTHDLDEALYLGHYINVLSKKVTQLLESFENKYYNLELNEESLLTRNKLKTLLYV